MQVLYSFANAKFPTNKAFILLVPVIVRTESRLNPGTLPPAKQCDENWRKSFWNFILTIICHYLGKVSLLQMAKYRANNVAIKSLLLFAFSCCSSLITTKSLFQHFWFRNIWLEICMILARYYSLTRSLYMGKELLEKIHKGKYHCFADLQFYLFGVKCFAYIEWATYLLVWSNQNQSNRRSVYSDTSPYNVIWYSLILTYLYSPDWTLLPSQFTTSVTRLGDLLHFGQLFKAIGNN